MSQFNKISLQGLRDLQEKSRESGSFVKTLSCRTIAVDKFRHENHIRNLNQIIDEPPTLLGDDSAPNPSESLLASLGTCIAVGIQSNLVHRNIDFRKIVLELEADIDITAVWGTGEVADKVIGFTAVRLKVDLDSDLSPQEKDKLIEHVLTYSPVTASVRKPVPVTYISEAVAQT